MKRFLFFSIALFVTLVCSNVLAAARGIQDTWQRIAPVGESFSVLMPKAASEGSRRIPLDNKGTYIGRVYYCTANSKRYEIMSFAKTKPEWHDALESLERFVIGIEVSLKSTKNTLVFDRELSAAERPVRQYNLTIGKYSGVARLIGAGNWFYVVMVIGAESTSAEADQFLSSFTVGPANTESTNVMVDGEAYLNVDSARAPDTELPPEPWPDRMRPISGGILNGKALFLQQPEYPAEARQSGDSGDVQIRVVIDEQGKIIAAKAYTGARGLQDAAIAAALKSRFSPTRLSGQPMKVMGVIQYNFVP